VGKKIPSDIDVKIIRTYLIGLKRDETAKRFSISDGYVSNKWDEFKKQIGPEGEALRDLSIRLKQKEVTVEEASASVEVAYTIRKMNIDGGELQEFLSKVYKASVDNRYAAEQVVGYSIELYDLSIKMNVSFE
jgi:hypothetical protein